MSKDFLVEMGIRQRDAFYPILFNIVLELVVRKVQKGTQV